MPFDFLKNYSCSYVIIIIPNYYRNEKHQEELWDISCELLKEWMSPEIWDKYGPSKHIGQHTDKD